ncbi:hypothetical protein G7070_13740 [Propioniciclava coleopterorum]|uniref:Uncharacterized protein n=1 Tax=Propioniciclava coleopterorum TaxID=2714937 RepID=A0A6G7Y8W8_9ACTN|nr:hypothetical protein [Propioniciclava coleopterorum]QIK73126.1 hypothetical protein G7070_13740 [Propioniciclava coleopterorum]
MARYGWAAAGWAVAGLLVALAFAGMFTIGVFVLPVAAAVVALLVWRTAGRGWPGLLVGVAALVLWIAARNRLGPGEVCTPMPDGTSCTEYYDPVPLLVAGCALLVVAALGLVAGGVRAARRGAAAAAAR